LKLNTCKSIFFLTTIKWIHDDNDLDLKKTVMFTSTEHLLCLKEKTE
jgi:hypothetical protein